MLVFFRNMTPCSLVVTHQPSEENFLILTQSNGNLRREKQNFSMCCFYLLFEQGGIRFLRNVCVYKLDILYFHVLYMCLSLFLSSHSTKSVFCIVTAVSTSLAQYVTLTPFDDASTSVSRVSVYTAAVSNFYSPIELSESRQREKRIVFKWNQNIGTPETPQLWPPVEVKLPASAGLAGGQQRGLRTASKTSHGRATEQSHTDILFYSSTLSWN